MANSSVVEWLEGFWRYGAVHTLTFTFLLLNLVSFSIPYAGDVKPFFLLMVVYYWALYRPALIPPALVFVYGLIMDFASGTPFVGLSALSLLAAQWIVKSQRLFLMGQTFIMIWLGFFLIGLVAVSLEWFVFSLLSWKIAALAPVAAGMGLSVLIFPAISAVLYLSHRLLPFSGKGYK